MHRTDTWRGRLAHRVALAAVSVGTLTTYWGVASGQTPLPTSEEPLVEVVVTGSRIPIPNDVAISPVTEVNSALIERTGVTRIEDLLNSLPQVFADRVPRFRTARTVRQRSTCAVSAQGARLYSLTVAGSDPVIPKVVVNPISTRSQLS